ncbi:cytosol aminopeptidase [Nematocida sp. AWRm77]|nr:cytosol aminopeptidase [Nematocida sp. AWRm77]
MEIDWRRMCCRHQATVPEGAQGAVLLVGEGIALPEALQSTLGPQVDALPPVETNRWVLYLDRVYAVCKLKPERQACPAYVRKTAAKGVSCLVGLGVASIEIMDGYMAEWVAEAVVLGTYQYDAKHAKKKTQVGIVYAGESEEVKKAILMGEAQNFARFLVDTPANLMTPTLFTEYAKEYLKNDSVKVSVFGKKDLTSMNMHLLLGVASGSAEEPKLLQVEYTPVKGAPPVALVGKGITFDSGGISLKPSAKMALMKGDMGGGAAVVATVGALSRLQVQKNVVCLVPLTENLPSGTATKPGDVHVGAGGISVEVDNTDAEGRLVLGDALHHALSFSPEKIVDVATLTGAINVALGPVMAGLFSNADELANELLGASSESQDLIWRLPVTDDYKSLISSTVADLKNTGGPAGGSITAALFLKAFIGSTPWAHLDIASVAHNTLMPELYGSGATGRPVKLLISWLSKQQ